MSAQYALYTAERYRSRPAVLVGVGGERRRHLVVRVKLEPRGGFLLVRNGGAVVLLGVQLEQHRGDARRAHAAVEKRAHHVDHHQLEHVGIQLWHE
eukprot:scaffold10589_cov38-Phaeocystis_antarctica.AAC.2